MAFNLTEHELDRALAAIEFHGYGALLPPAPEWQVIHANWPAVREKLQTLDLDTNRTISPLRIYAPKSRSNLRVVSLLHPQDLIIYTALTLIAKNDIEAARVPKRARRVFSYRADPAIDDQLYEARGSFEEYKRELRARSNAPNCKFVAVADIADFYPRINQHRLSNVIQTSARSARVEEVARVLEKFLSNLAGSNSYGIPVGPFASRLLAEATLIDIDAIFGSEKVNFVRWVDDFNFFCRSEGEAQRILFKLGERLYENHGLTLSTAKTHIFTARRYRRQLLADPERLVDRSVTRVRQIAARLDPYLDEEVELSEEEINELHDMNYANLLDSAFTNKDLIDYETLSVLLKHRTVINNLTAKSRREIAAKLIENVEHLYPVAEDVSSFFQGFVNADSPVTKKIAKALLKPLLSKSRQPPDYYAIWILNLFASSEKWGHAPDLLAVYNFYRSEAVRRFAALALATNGTRAHAMAIKGDYANASPLSRLGILFATRQLGTDERKHWKQSVGVSGIVEKLI